MNESPWVLPKLAPPSSDGLPVLKNQPHRNKKMYRISLRGSRPALQDVPSRDNINTVSTLQRDRTDMIKRGGR